MSSYDSLNTDSMAPSKITSFGNNSSKISSSKLTSSCTNSNINMTGTRNGSKEF